MKTAAVVIAGGRSSRMGRDKASIHLAGKPVMQWIVGRIAPQAAAVAINAKPGRFEEFDLTVFSDLRNDVGTPLAGLHAAFHWARDLGYAQVLTVPSDSPFLPHDLVPRLEGKVSAIAASGGQRHFLTGLWSTDLLEPLERALDLGLRRAQDWAAQCGAAAVTWPAEPFDPFFNINTPEDLSEAERIVAEFNP